MERKPLPSERAETVAFVWPNDAPPPAPLTVPHYQCQFAVDRTWFERVQAASGWQVTSAQWAQLSAELLPGSMVFATKSGEPVGVATALVRDNGWRELAWVAVDVESRGQRLGKLLCAVLIRKLLDSGEKLIVGSTQDERIAALRNYLEIGFHPVYRQEKVERWRAICRKLNWPFTPQLWQWPSL